MNYLQEGLNASPLPKKPLVDKEKDDKENKREFKKIDYLKDLRKQKIIFPK